MKSPLVLELGSHSLKAHFESSEAGAIQDIRFPWSLGHDVYESGQVRDTTLAQALEAKTSLREKGIDGASSSLFAVATGALRDADDPEAAARLLEDRLGVTIRILSGREEASLLAEGFFLSGGRAPALLGDLGGGSLELVSIGKDAKSILRETLPLGAVRLERLGREEGQPWNRKLVQKWIRDCLAEEASAVRAAVVHATGGTIKAIARVLGETVIPRDQLIQLEERVVRDGTPPVLDSARRRVFLPGLMAIRALVEYCEAEAVHYTNVSIGKVLLRRLKLRAAAGKVRQTREALLKNMRLTDVYLTPGPDDDSAPDES